GRGRPEGVERARHVRRASCPIHLVAVADAGPAQPLAPAGPRRDAAPVRRVLHHAQPVGSDRIHLEPGAGNRPLDAGADRNARWRYDAMDDVAPPRGPLFQLGKPGGLMAATTRAIALASRWFDEQTYRRTFEPLIADWQREWQDAPPRLRT